MEVFQVSQPDPTQPAALEPEAHGGELTDHTKLVDPMTMEDSSVPFLNNAEAAVQSAVRKHKVKPLSLLPLVALIFYDVSGGPFGIEVCYPACMALILTQHLATNRLLCKFIATFVFLDLMCAICPVHDAELPGLALTFLISAISAL